MSFLDQILGNKEKEAVSRLRAELLEKDSLVTQLQTKLGALEKDCLEHQQALRQLSSSLADGAAGREDLQRQLNQERFEAEALRAQFETLRRSTAEEHAKAAATISALQEQSASLAAETAAAKAEHEASTQQLAKLQALSSDKDRSYTDREARLAEKSEKLQQERHKFQQQATDLQRREQRWQHVVKPQLARYEGHLSLDLRKKELDAQEGALVALQQRLTTLESDLVRRQCSDDALRSRETEIVERERLLSARGAELDVQEGALAGRRSELDEQAFNLEKLSKELPVSSHRAGQLDQEAADLEARGEEIQSKEDQQKARHAERMAELRQQRTELHKERKALDLRESNLQVREKEVKKEETLNIRESDKNFGLRQDNKELKAQLAECEAKYEVSAAEALRLAQENPVLKERIQRLKTERDGLEQKNCSLLKQINELTGSLRGRHTTVGRPELNIRQYEPSTDGRTITPPPASLRSNSPLTAMHYHVGVSGIQEEEERRELLREIIKCSLNKLPKIGPAEYMRQWGEAMTALRVRCIAYHLSWNINFQGAKDTNQAARQDWLDDLQWLTKHYRGKTPRSKWPKVLGP